MLDNTEPVIDNAFILGAHEKLVNGKRLNPPDFRCRVSDMRARKSTMAARKRRIDPA